MAHLRTILLAVLLLLSGTGVAQSGFSLEPRLGYGTFQMSSMKELQQNIIRATGVKAKATDTFGPYFQYGLNGVFELTEQTSIGLFLEHGSTGGRVAYEDYSGEFTVDMLLNYNALGMLFFREEPLANSRFSYVVGIESSMFRSKLHIATNSRLYDYTETSEDTYNSLGLGLKPYVGLQYPLMSKSLRLTLGYLASANGPFRVPDKPDHYLVRNSNNDKLEPSWSGLRLNLSVSLPITK